MQMIRLHFKRFFSLRQTLSFYLAFTIMLILLATVFNHYQETLETSDQIRLGVINEDTHQLAQVLMSSFQESDTFTALFDLTFDTESLISRAFDKGDLDAYIQIPEGFTEGLLTYENMPITIHGHLENPIKNRLIEEILSGYASYIDTANAATWSLYYTMEKADLTGAQIVKINNAFSVEMIGATLGRASHFELDQYTELPTSTALGYFLLALPLAMMTFITVNSGMVTIQQRQEWHYRRLSISGMPFWWQVVSEQTAQWLSGLILLMPAVLGLIFFTSTAMALWGTLALMLSLLFWQSSWRLLSYGFKDPAALGLLASTLGFMVTLAGGGLVPFILLPVWLKRIGSLTPLFQFNRIGLEQQPIFPLFLFIGMTALIIALEILILATGSRRRGPQ